MKTPPCKTIRFTTLYMINTWWCVTEMSSYLWVCCGTFPRVIMSSECVMQFSICSPTFLCVRGWLVALKRSFMVQTKWMMLELLIFPSLLLQMWLLMAVIGRIQPIFKSGPDWKALEGVHESKGSFGCFRYPTHFLCECVCMRVLFLWVCAGWWWRIRADFSLFPHTFWKVEQAAKDV